MILQALEHLYRRRLAQPDSDIAPPGWIRRAVDYVFVLASNGQCANVLTNFASVNGKRIARPELLPAIGKQARKHTNSGQDPNLLWDVASFATGYGADNAEKLGCFAAAVESWFESTEDDGLQALRMFLARAQADPPWLAAHVDRYGLREDFDKRNPVVAFQLLGDADPFIHARARVRDAYEVARQRGTPGAAYGHCLVTGGIDVPLATNETVITGVWESQTSGANIVSFNKSAFGSYGKRNSQGENAPISQAASFAYTTALNDLLASPRNRVRVGDASIVFWAADPSQFDSEFTLADIFDEPQPDNPFRGREAVKALYEAVNSGKLTIGEGGARFFVLGLAAPSRARITVRFWLPGMPFAELAPRILRHFEDINVAANTADPSVEHVPLNSLLASVGSPTQRPSDDTVYSRHHRKHVRVPRALGGLLMEAVLGGLPYPRQLLEGAVQRCRREATAKEASGRALDHVPRVRAGVLRGCINRLIRTRLSHLKEIAVALDRTNTDPFYRLGRLFAIYEGIQRAALGRDLNRTIRDSYFGSAMTAPRGVLSRLGRLAEAHLRDISRDKPGLARHFEQEIGSVVWDISVEQFAPSTAGLEDQARFILGYYHQRHYRSPQATSESTPDQSTEEN